MAAKEKHWDNFSEREQLLLFAMKEIFSEFKESVQKSQRESEERIENKIQKVEAQMDSAVTEIKWVNTFVKSSIVVGMVILVGALTGFGVLFDFVNDQYQARLEKMEHEVFASKSDLILEKLDRTHHHGRGHLIKKSSLKSDKKKKHIKK